MATAVAALLINIANSATAATQIVMVTGDLAPDGNGVFQSSGLSVGGLNDSGQVVFGAQLVGTSGGLNDNLGLFRGDGVNLVQIVRSGQAVPGSPGAAFSPSIPFGSPALNDVGQVAFAAFVTLNNGTLSQGIFRGSGTAQSLTQIALQGQPMPDGNGALNSILSKAPALNNAGQVALYVEAAGAMKQIQRYAVVRGDGASLTQIARGGSGVGGGGSFVTLTAGPVVNESGEVAFGGDLQLSTNLSFGSGVVVGDGSTTTLYAPTGQKTPDGKGTFLGEPTSPFLNQSNQVAFVADVSGLTGAYHGLYFVTGTTLMEVARTGQVVPGIPDQALDQFEWLFMNNAGQVAFTAITCCTAGIFRWSVTSGSLTNLVLKGQATPDRNGIIDLLPAAYDSPVDLNDAGQIVFASQVTGGSLFNDLGIV